MSTKPSPQRFNCWLYLRTDTQLEHAKTLPGFSQDRYVPTARADRRRQVTYGTRAETDAAKIALYKRFPTLKEPAVKVAPYRLMPSELQRLRFDEGARDAWWKGKRGVRMSPKPWDVYVDIWANGESFSVLSNRVFEVLPGSYGPLPLRPSPTYAPGTILDWLAQRGYHYPYARPTGVRTRRFAVTKQIAQEMVFRF